MTSSQDKLERKTLFENLDKLQDQQRRMAWLAMLSMIAVTVAVLFVVPKEVLEASTAAINGFYMAQAGVVAAFMAASAYTSTRNGGQS